MVQVQKVQKDEYKRILKLAELLDIPTDENSILFQAFREILLASSKGKGVKTSEFCKRVSKSQSAVVYYFNTLINKGIVERRGWYYVIRGNNCKRFADIFESMMYHRIRMIRKIINELYDEYED